MKLRTSFFMVFFFILSGISIAAKVETKKTSAEKKAAEVYQEGMDFFLKGEMDEAADAFEAAVYLDEDYFFLLSGNGVLDVILKKESKSSAKKIRKLCLNGMIKHHKKGDFFSYYYLGWAELNIGNPKKTIRALKKAQSLMEKENVEADVIKVLLEKAQARVKEK